MKCPYYRAIATEDLLQKVKGYCDGYSNGKLRVPTLYEETNFCSAGNFSKCPVFKTRAKCEGMETMPPGNMAE